VAVDFRQILRFDSDLPEMRSYLFEDSVIDETQMICESTGIERVIYRRFEDSSLIVVESIPFTNLIENLINLCHPCLAAPIDFGFTAGARELKVLRFHSESESLAEVIATSPMWWTPTAKAKAFPGLLLGLRFAHTRGLIHGYFPTNSIVLDSNHCIEFTSFLRDLSGKGIRGFSSERWNLETDVLGSVSMLFEIVVGRPASADAALPADVPKFVSEGIEAEFSGEWRRLSSFQDVFERL
jgi:hypothetical protein